MIKIDLTKDIDFNSKEWKNAWQYLRASQLRRGFSYPEDVTFRRFKKAYERKLLVKEKLTDMFPTIDWNVKDPEYITLCETPGEWFTEYDLVEDLKSPALHFIDDNLEDKTIDVRENLDVKENNTIKWSSVHVPDFRAADYVAVTDPDNKYIHLYKNVVKKASKNWFTLVKVGIIKC